MNQFRRGVVFAWLGGHTLDSTTLRRIQPKGPMITKIECPNCFHQMDRATCLSRPDNTPPQPGDVTICIRCAAVLVFNDVGVEAPDEDCIRELLTDGHVVAAQKLVRRMISVRRSMEAAGV